MNKKHFLFTLLAIIFTGIGLSLTACGGDDNDEPDTDSEIPLYALERLCNPLWVSFTNSNI